MDDATPPPDHAEQEWMLHARCRSLAPGEFFPSDGVGVEKARRICAQCSVVNDCLEYALQYRIEHGVWGGASERERRRIMRRRRTEVADPAAARRAAEQAGARDLGEPVTIG
jgi:WhiB family redox-sensing transcriptional regulator